MSNLLETLALAYLGWMVLLMALGLDLLWRFCVNVENRSLI
jgi:hypothetical protein